MLLLGSSSGYTTLNSGLSSTSNNTLVLPTTASDTLAALGTAETWTAGQKFTSGDLLALGSSTGTNALNSLNTGANNYTTGIPAASGNLSVTLMQSAIPFVYPPNGYIDATGHVVFGANPPGTVYLSSSTAGTGITITCNTACFTGTAAGDTGRWFVFSDGTCCASAKTFVVTGNSGSSSTIAQGTLETTLTTACTSGSPCAAASIHESGPVFTATNAAANGTTYSAPLPTSYASGYWYFPASSAFGSAEWLYCTMTSPNLSTALCYNNAYAGGLPTIPGSPTAFSGLTAAAYTQTTGSAIAAVTATVPGNSMGVNGMLQNYATTSNNNSAGAKEVFSKFGGAANQNIAYNSSTYSSAMLNLVQNRGVANAQLITPTDVSTNNGSTPNGYASVDTTSNQTNELLLETGVATDWEVLEAYSFIEFPN
jgi:hypothetical protein